MHCAVKPAARMRDATLACARCVLLVGLVFAIDRAFAAGKVYRCGNTFQDSPCSAPPTADATPPKPVVRHAEPPVTSGVHTADRIASERGAAVVLRPVVSETRR